MVTFYTVLLCIVVFFRLRPLNSALIIGLSSMVFYVILEFAVKPGKIQPINYTLFILILVGSSIVRYRVGVNSLNQKLRVEELNGALEDIANHDSLTHLYNRHSLSRMIPSYVGADICLREYSTDKGRPELSFAYGFVRLNAADLSAVHEAISRADKLLYENKKNAR